ncbi:acyl-CoA hydrolase [Neobacillus niacini]|nr:acyl-CoA hydrolase [Neobacillus niacini]
MHKIQIRPVAIDAERMENRPMMYIEVFVKIIAEDLKSGEHKIAATALLTFVALDEHKRPARVPQIIPETEEEKKLHETAPERNHPWDQLNS